MSRGDSSSKKGKEEKAAGRRRAGRKKEFGAADENNTMPGGEEGKSEGQTAKNFPSSFLSEVCLKHETCLFREGE